MNRKLKNENKGITLIALIITIIIMLILVVTAVSVTMNSGLFEKAAKAGEEWERNEINLVSEGVSYIDAIVAKYTGGTGECTGHEVENWTITKVATCTEVGQKEGTCKHCGATGTEPIPAIGHNWENGTCTNENCGLICNHNFENGECTVCGEKTTQIIAREEANNEYIKNNENITEVVQTKTEEGILEAPIPSGFKASRVTGEGAIDTGLVIYENETEINDSSDVATAKQSYNQFVWIPVEEVEDMYICHVFNSEGTGTEATACEFEIANIDSVEFIQCGTHGETDIAGYLYTDNAMTTRITSYTETSGRREPGLVDGKTDGTGTSYDKAQSSGTYTNLKTISDILGTTGYDTPANFAQTLQDDYNKIATSILKYKGFYVGRYESSNIKANDTDSLIVQAGKTPTNKTNWYTMYAKQKLYKLTDKAVGSTMINGAAYDQVIKFVNGGERPDKKQYTALTAGNVYHGSSLTEPYETGNTNYPTAATEYNDLVKNIYDLEGNVTAWTTEANHTSSRVYRGRLLQLQHVCEPSQRQLSD